ncbi:acetoin utilization protein AcuC [Angustibacter aerolatus]|uniref:Acetoin utilization protein AcuC n=1 Tax=Angustibacter aerolatus TaxID=1162965 RepID=A0ABQ6JIY4_9ACTN|nr:acetoin utilization protein AcuC [Angustibacter aerolatus]
MLSGPDAPDVEVVPAEVADDDVLATVHDRDYVAAVRAASDDPSGRADPAYGLGTDDDPAFAGMHDASARIVGGTVDVARAVGEGRAQHGVNFAGGMHHAMPGRASGFCVYNDVAAGVRALLDAGAQRVAYVDVDVHHGDGVERVFWDDPRVLTISLHESGRMLFPGTGFPDDLGGPAAEGTAVNVALPPGTGDAGWLRALHAVVPRSSAPSSPTSSSPSTAATATPSTRSPTSPSPSTPSASPRSSSTRLAHEVADGRWVATGGGGYEVVDVVPRSWAHLVALAAHRPVDPTTAVPRAWLDHVARSLDRTGPQRMTDGSTPGGGRGRSATTPTTRSTAPSSPPARPSSPCTVWILGSTRSFVPGSRSRPGRPGHPPADWLARGSP